MKQNKNTNKGNIMPATKQEELSALETKIETMIDNGATFQEVMPLINDEVSLVKSITQENEIKLKRHLTS
jgi:hypothetical protein